MPPLEATFTLWGLWALSWIVAAYWSDRAEKRTARGRGMALPHCYGRGRHPAFRRLLSPAAFPRGLSLGAFDPPALVAEPGGEMGCFRDCPARAGVCLVGAALSRPPVVEFGDEEGQSSHRRHRPLRNRAPSDLHRHPARRCGHGGGARVGRGRRGGAGLWSSDSGSRRGSKSASSASNWASPTTTPIAAACPC